jgi:hypothetical protein
LESIGDDATVAKECQVQENRVPWRLNVECQEVVDIEAGAGDGRGLVDGAVRAVPVVLVGPRGQVAEAIGGVLIEAHVSPLADGGLDEGFGFTVGLRGVDAGRRWRRSRARQVSRNKSE